MKRKLQILIMLLLFTLFSFNLNFGGAPVVAENNQYSKEVELKKLDERAKILSDYLAKYNSPMQYSAQDFVDAADRYGLDWRMLPAIAGVESTFGKQIPGGYNAYGWGIYGSNRIYFKSWREGIFTVAKGLKEGYLDRGLADPYSINRIYAESKTWGRKVSFFMNDLENYSKSRYVSGNKISSSSEHPRIAAVSGQLKLY